MSLVPPRPLACALLSGTLFGVAHAQAPTDTARVDTNYVIDNAHMVTVRIFSSTKFNTLSLLGDGDHTDLRYRPNNQINIGVGVTYRRLTLNIGLKAPWINRDDDRYGRTRYIDAQANMLSPERATNLFLQFFKGYHISYPGRTVISWPGQVTEDPYRPDVQQFNVGISTLRITNSRRFSYRAAFNQDAWQRRSQGTWLYGGYAIYYHVRGDSSLVPTALQGLFDDKSRIRIGDFADAGLMGGAAYTLVYRTHWFMTGSAALGVGMAVQHLRTSPLNAPMNEGTVDHWGPGWHIQARAGLGYNSARDQIGITYNQERILYSLAGRGAFAWSVGNVRLNLVHRFSERPTFLTHAFRWLKRRSPAGEVIK